MLNSSYKIRKPRLMFVAGEYGVGLLLMHATKEVESG